MKKLLLLIQIMLVSACISGPYPVSSPYYQIPAGSHLILKQALTIPPNTGRVYIQGGKVVSNEEKDQYYSHCWFISWKISDTPTLISPDDFLITSSQKDEYYVNRQKPLLFASAGIIIRSVMSVGATAIEYSTELTIHSDNQPDIRQFVCSHWEDPADAQHLTIAEINKTLGNIAELKPANM